MHQQIQYCKSADGVQLAYATIGKGTPILRTGNWLTHLDYDLKSPVWRHVFLGLAQRHRLIRFDARGTGLSHAMAKFIPLEGKNHLFLANEPAHRAFFDAVTDFLGDPPLPDPLPGASNPRERLDRFVRDIEQSWIIKVVIIAAAITGVVIFFLEMWKLLQH